MCLHFDEIDKINRERLLVVSGEVFNGKDELDAKWEWNDVRKWMEMWKSLLEKMVGNFMSQKVHFEFYVSSE